MNSTRRPVTEVRTVEDRPHTTGAKRVESPRRLGASQAENCNSGILRELAERMRHWD